MPRTKKSALFLASMSVLAVAACSGNSGAHHAKSDAPMPPISEMDAAMNAPAPQPLSGSDTLTPVMQAASDENIEMRMARLEQAVDSLRNDYGRIAPAFATLNTTNERIQTLLSQIERETGVTPSAPSAGTTTATSVVSTAVAPPPATGTVPAAGQVSTPLIATTSDIVASAAPVASPASPQKVIAAETADAPTLAAFKTMPTVEEARAEAARQTGKSETAATWPNAKPAKAASASIAGTEGNSVKGLRIGEHGASTRLVFDLTGNAKPELRYDVDAAENLLVVDMPGTGWNGAVSGAPKSPMIQGWSVNKGAESGSTVAVQLKKNARVVSTEFLKGEGGKGARYVVDIAAGV